MHSLRAFCTRHKRTLLVILFLGAFSLTVVYATPPTSPYNPGETLDPTCLPTDTNCTVTIFPDQTTHAGQFLQTDGTHVSWATVASGGGSGTVTSFSAGTLSPLFTTSVSTATSTPALSFVLTNAGANTIFGNNTGSSAAPAYSAATTYSDKILNLSSTGLIKRTGANTYAIATPGTDYVRTPQNLQSVTDVGNTTTDSIFVITDTGYLGISRNSTQAGAGLYTNSTNGGFLNIVDNSNFATKITTSGIYNTFNKLLSFPTAAGTFALSTTVNGNTYTADSSGNINLGTISGGGGESTTASNGLTLSGSDVQLGGTLTGNTTINAGGFTTNFAGVIDGSAIPIVSINNSTTLGGIALKVTNSSPFQAALLVSGNAYGISSSSTNTGIYTIGNSIGIQTESTNGTALIADVNPSSTNSVATIAKFERVTTGTAANGIGGSIDFYNKSTTSVELSNQVISKWTNATDASRTSEFSVTGVNSAVTNTLFTLAGNGAAKLNQYGSGTFTGTATHNLAVDASGNIIEVATGGGATPDLQAVTDQGNVTTLGITALQFIATGAGGDNPVVAAVNTDIDEEISLVANNSRPHPFLNFGFSGSGWDSILAADNVTGDREWQLPNASGTLALGVTDGSSTVTAGTDGIIDISSLLGGGGGSSRFGISGEDDTAAEDRSFSLNDNSFEIIGSDGNYGTLFNIGRSPTVNSVTSNINLESDDSDGGGFAGVNIDTDDLDITGPSILVGKKGSALYASETGDSALIAEINGTLDLFSSTNQYNLNGVTYSLPTALGNDGDVLTTDASGNLSWAAGGGGGEGGGNTLYTGDGTIADSTNRTVTLGTNVNFLMGDAGNLNALYISNGSGSQFGGMQVGDGTNAASINITGNTSNDLFQITTSNGSNTIGINGDANANTLNFSGFGLGNHTGTAAYNLAVDSSGNIIEVAAGGGGGSQDLQSVTDVGNTTTNSIIISDSNQSFTVQDPSVNSGLARSLLFLDPDLGGGLGLGYDYVAYVYGSNITGANKAIQLPNASGTLALGVTDGSSTVTAGADGIIDISSLLTGGGGGSSRFGVSGEDDTAAEDRSFELGTHTLNIDAADDPIDDSSIFLSSNSGSISGTDQNGYSASVNIGTNNNSNLSYAGINSSNSNNGTGGWIAADANDLEFGRSYLPLPGKSGSAVIGYDDINSLGSAVIAESNGTIDLFSSTNQYNLNGVTYSLPTALGNDGDVLATDADGNLSWVDPGTASNTLYTSNGSLLGDRNVDLNSNMLNFDGNNDTTVHLDPNGYFHFNTADNLGSNARLDLDGYTGDDTTFDLEANDVNVGNTVDVLGDATTQTLTLTANNGVVINNSYTLPLADGEANQVLTTDGAGNLSWVDPIGSAGTCPEEITNGTFDTDASGWDLTGATYDSGHLDGDGGTTDFISQDGTLIDGDTYTVTFDVTGASGADITMNLADGDSQSWSSPADGTLSFTGVWGANTYIMQIATHNFSGTIDNISVKKQTCGGGGNTLYTADDALTGNRTVDLAGNELDFSQNGNTLLGLDTADFESFMTATDGTANSYIDLNGNSEGQSSFELLSQGEGSAEIVGDGNAQTIALTAANGTFVGDSGVTPVLSSTLFNVNDGANNWISVGNGGGAGANDILFGDPAGQAVDSIGGFVNQGVEFLGNINSTEFNLDDSAQTIELDAVNGVAISGDLTVFGSATTCTIGNGTGATLCSSDQRLKTNVTPLGDDALDNIMALNPVTFTWIDPKKPQGTNIGFIAQEVQQVFPQFVGVVGKDGTLGLDYAGLITPTIKAVQELDLKIESIDNLTNGTDDAPNFIDNLIAWFGNAENGIKNLFAKEVDTENLCVTDDSGAKTCITKAELDTLLSNTTHTTTVITPSSTTDTTTPPDDTTTTTPPTDDTPPTDTPADTPELNPNDPAVETGPAKAPDPTPTPTTSSDTATNTPPVDTTSTKTSSTTSTTPPASDPATPPPAPSTPAPSADTAPATPAPSAPAADTSPAPSTPAPSAPAPTTTP